MAKLMVKLAVAMATLASAEVLAESSYSDVRMQDWVSVDFSDVPSGPLTTDAGAKGGSWGATPIPEGATANVTTTNSARALVFDTSSSEQPLVFKANVRKSQTKDVFFSLFFPSAEDTIDLDNDTKAGFMVCANRYGSPAFMGYTSEGWVELSSANTQAAFDTWIEGKAHLSEGETKVSYFIKTASGDYETLVDTQERDVFDTAGSGPSLGKFEFRGHGAFGGMDSAYRNASIKLWVR